MSLKPQNEITVQFQNIAAWLNDGARYSTEWSWQFFVSQSPEEIYDNFRTHIDPMIDPILKQDSDVVSFSEVFGVRQRDYIKAKLEWLGYTVYFTDAFEMWSQMVEGEHLYNMVWIKEDKLWKPEVTHHEFRNKRKIEGVAFAMNYLFPVLPYTPRNNNTQKVLAHVWNRVKDIVNWERGIQVKTSPEIGKAKAIYNRLANGILDWAITVLDFDWFTFATGHVHKFNYEVVRKLEGSISDKPFMLLWDMNVDEWDIIKTHPPFATPDWKSILDPKTRTFWFRARRWLGNRIATELSHFQPDVLVAKWFDAQRVTTVRSKSDHDGIAATMTYDKAG